MSAAYGIGIEEHDKEGRVITLEFDEYYFVTVYTPNSQSELRRLEYRMKWEEDFLAYLLKLQEKKNELARQFTDGTASGGVGTLSKDDLLDLLS